MDGMNDGSRIALHERRGLTLVLLSAAWLIGVVLADWLHPSLSLVIAAILALLALLLCWRANRVRMVGLLVTVLLLGACRYALADPHNDPFAIAALIGAGRLEIRGTVSAPPTLQGHARLLSVDVESVSRNGGADWQPAHGQIRLLTPGSLEDDPYGPSYGDAVQITGSLQPPPAAAPRGLQAVLTFPRVVVRASGGNPLLAALYRLRLALAALIARTLPQPEAALLIALLLGLRTPALRPLVPLFSVTGTAHLIAPGGFKVTVLAGLLATLLKPLAQQRPESRWLLPAERRRAHWRLWPLCLLQLLAVAVYTVLSGASPAALRAGLMGALLLLAPRLERTYYVYSSLAATALLISLGDPFVLWDSSFQLSFLGTLGIVLLTPGFDHPLRPLKRLPAGSTIAEMLAVTLAAQVATLPIFALTFATLSFVAPLTNVLTVPLLEPLLFLGVVICLLGTLWFPLGLVCGWVAWFPLHYMLAAVTFTAHLPAAYLSTAGWPLSAPLAWGYYALLTPLVLIWRRPLAPLPSGTEGARDTLAPRLSRSILRRLQVVTALLLIAATGSMSLLSHGDGSLTVTFFALTASPRLTGMAVLVSTPAGRTLLIDGGPDAGLLDQTIAARLPFWQRRLDLLLLTTPLRTHLPGLQEAALRFQVGQAFDAGMLHPSAGYALWRRTLREARVSYSTVRRGAVAPLEPDLRLEVLWPPSPLHRSSDEARDNALVLRLVTPGLRLFLLGEAAQSSYALNGLTGDGAQPAALQTDVVQLSLSAAKALPAALPVLLRRVHPALLVVNMEEAPSASSTAAQNGEMARLLAGPWQLLLLTPPDTLAITARATGWTIQSASECC
jgi:competence protein ComEC